MTWLIHISLRIDKNYPLDLYIKKRQKTQRKLQNSKYFVLCFKNL